MKLAKEQDAALWRTMDSLIPPRELARRMAEERTWFVCDEEKPVGVFRWGMFWDNTPFLNLIILEEDYRRRGFGRQAMLWWEDVLRKEGHSVAMTSTNVDEEAQHFYRKLGYKDCGCLVLDVEPMAQAMEMFLIKEL